jgi:hypothetical protein
LEGGEMKEERERIVPPQPEKIEENKRSDLEDFLDEIEEDIKKAEELLKRDEKENE